MKKSVLDEIEEIGADLLAIKGLTNALHQAVSLGVLPIENYDGAFLGLIKIIDETSEKQERLEQRILKI